MAVRVIREIQARYGKIQARYRRDIGEMQARYSNIQARYRREIGEIWRDMGKALGRNHSDGRAGVRCCPTRFRPRCVTSVHTDDTHHEAHAQHPTHTTN